MYIDIYIKKIYYIRSITKLSPAAFEKCQERTSSKRNKTHSTRVLTLISQTSSHMTRLHVKTYVSTLRSNKL